MRPPSACACPASKRPDLPDASPQRAEAGAVPCGKYSSTLRRVLKYLAESTVPHSARQHPAFRDGTGGNGGDASSDRDDSPTILIERQNQNNMRTCILLLLMLFLPRCAEGIRAGAFSPDTFRFEFALYGQTRRFAMKFEPADDSVAIRWSMPRHGKVYGGTYRMGKRSVEDGSRLCFLQPGHGKAIDVPADETAFMLSRKALRQLHDSLHFVYGNTRYDLVDSLPAAPGLKSLHVADRTEGCEMWIVDDLRLPLVWRMKGNPLGIDWTVTNVAEAMSRADGKLRVAFIADPHVQDVVSRPELARTMAAQLGSTRLFNENIHAFRSALDDVAARGIRLVVLPGDLTDNGQAANVEAVRRMLDAYMKRHGMMFFVTTGNHDPAQPRGKDYVADDLLSADGRRTAMASSKELGSGKLPVDTTLHCLGYEELMRAWAAFGYSPREEYLYWSTPFSKYDYEDYTLDEAEKAATPQMRRYMLGDSLQGVDASYVVEPVEGLWLLAIDGNVFLPERTDDAKDAYRSPSAGYSNVWKHKRFLIEWTGRVAADARRLGKTLVAFCHYPATDFHNGAGERISSFMKPKAMNLHRVPPREVGTALLEAGIGLHFAGHLHQNHTAVVSGGKGRSLYNIQVPSTAADVPAYKILTLESPGRFRVETVVLDTVGGFRDLWPRYMKERALAPGVWDTDILYSPDYAAFCDRHFRSLVTSRYLEKEMPAVVRDSIARMDGAALMRLAGLHVAEGDTVAWTGMDLVTDLYRLHFAGSLSRRHIPRSRMAQYRALWDACAATAGSGKKTPATIQSALRDICAMMKAFAESEPDGDFGAVEI